MEYLALFLTQNLEVIGHKKFKPTVAFINFKKGTFNVRLDAYLYRIKDSFVYGYIYPTDERLLIDNKEVIEQEPIKKNDKVKILNSPRLIKIQEQIERGDLHLIIAQSIIGQLAKAFLNTVKTNWLFLILALGAGVAIGYIACSVLYPPVQIVTDVINGTMPLPTPIILPTPTPIILTP